MHLKRTLAGIAAMLLSVTFAQAQESETVTIKGPNAPISAVYHKPSTLAEGAKCPIAIICHGFGSNKEGGLGRQVAVELERRGIATLLFDFAGSGASVTEKFKFVNMTVQTEVEDLEAVVKYARKLPFVDGIALVGHSMGGAVSLLAAADMGKKRVKCLAMMAPAVVLADDAARGIIFGIPFNPSDPPSRLELMGGQQSIGRKYIENAQETDFLLEATKYRGASLIICGTADNAVPFTYGKYLQRALPSSKLILHKGMDHSMMTPGDAESQANVTREVADFVASQF